MDNRGKKLTRHSRKVKNLEEEVEFIFSQDESDEDISASVNNEEILPKTPQTNKAKEATTPRFLQTVIQDVLQTPRRSCRKSIKPCQDYEDIVNKSLRSCTRSSKKLLCTEEVEEDLENQEAETTQPKWTPAKVGRVSQKRGRKSRRNGNSKKQEKTKEDKEMYSDNEVELPNEVNGVSDQSKNLTEKIVLQNEQTNKIEGSGDEINKPENKEILEQITNEYENKLVQKNEGLSKIIELKEQVDTTKNNTEKLEVKTKNIDFQESVENYIQEIQDIDSEKDDVNLNESIHLIQEDTEDCPEFEVKRDQEEICIVYESNISNIEKKGKSESEDEIQSISPKEKTEGRDFKGSFGCYLKSKDINISDLGLNPLKDEEEEKNMDVEDKNETKLSLHELEEMPSLIVCDDDEVEDEEPCNKFNKTFEANESVIVVEKDNAENCTKQYKDMESIQLSDDGDEIPKKRPRIVVTDTELSVTTIPSTPKSLPGTSKPKYFRFPTPYKNKQKLNFNNEVQENFKNRTPSKNILNISNFSFTTMEPKEIVLCGIRKRSISVCIEGNEQKRQKFLTGTAGKIKQDRTVSFYSPANQTAIIDDLDIIIAKSLKKRKPQEIDSSFKYVTTRRKRSMSLDESTISTSRLPRPVQNISSKPILRTKLPNFAAIHQKQFKKMENLEEHISRKQERSMNLINSATKIKAASSQNVSIIKKSNNISADKPNALKKIELGSNPQINRSLIKIASSTAALNKTQESSATKMIKRLPDPRLGLNKAINSETISHRQPQKQTLKKYLKPSQNTNIEKPRTNPKIVPSKPAFNLSTSLLVKPITTSTISADNANTSSMCSENKMVSRIQRHMDLFKGRVPSTRAGVASRKNDVLLKGVRSNRRFELQMQHRKNLEQ